MNAVLVVFGCVLVLLGTVVLSDGLLQQPVSNLAHSTLVRVLGVSAAAFVVFGGGLVFLARGMKRLTVGCGVVTSIAGVYLLLPAILQLDFEIGQLLTLYGYITNNTPYGPMAPNSAVCLLVGGICLILSATSQGLKYRSFLCGLMGLTIIAFNIIALLGYLYKPDSAYGGSDLPQIAIQITVGFIIFGVAMFLSAVQRDLSQQGHIPKWLALHTGLFMMALTIALWQALIVEGQFQVKKAIAQETVILKSDIEHRLSVYLLSLERMAIRWDLQGGTPKALWEEDAKNIVAHTPAITTLERINPQYQVVWSVSNNPDKPGNRSLPKIMPGLVNLLKGRNSVQQYSIISPMTLNPDGQGFQVYIPLRNADRFDGFIRGTFLFEDFFAPLMSNRERFGYSMAIYNNGKQVFQQDKAELKLLDGQKWANTERINLYNTHWDVRVWPNANLSGYLRSPMPTVILSSGFLLAVFMTLTLHFYLTTRRHNHEIALANVQLKQLTHDLKNINVELEAFSYSVSHDLRAPLRSIDGFSQLLLKEYHHRLDEVGKDYLQRVCASARRMAQLIDALLTLCRVTQSDLNMGVVNLSRMAHQIIAELQAQDAGRKVRFHIEPDLMAEGDSKLLYQALENLLGNAWKFTCKCPDPYLEFGAVHEGGRQVFYIKDNGAGFDMSFADKLFAPFQRLHSNADYPGTGVGLAIVQRVINRHGGQVWADGKVNEGAVFYFTLYNVG